LKICAGYAGTAANESTVSRSAETMVPVKLLETHQPIGRTNSCRTRFPDRSAHAPLEREHAIVAVKQREQ
jgi:hypothetical protein